MGRLALSVTTAWRTTRSVSMLRRNSSELPGPLCAAGGASGERVGAERSPSFFSSAALPSAGCCARTAGPADRTPSMQASRNKLLMEKGDRLGRNWIEGLRLWRIIASLAEELEGW